MKSTHLFITGSPFCNCLALSGKGGYNKHITFFWKLISRLWRCPRKTKEELPACPVATTVSLIGSKWKLLIMRNLLARPWRFNELRKDLDGISQKALTDSLRSMEADGLVVRTVYAEVPPRVEYALSPLGESMKPIIKSMETWGLAYKSGTLPGTAEEPA